MGCNIHFYVETRQADGTWKTADTWYDDAAEPGGKSIYNWGPGLERLGGPFYDGQNYDLFSILADVRNGRGFAGVKTGEGFVPISEPRGVPADACPEYLAEVARWNGDGHSHSYLTVAEVMAYDWTQRTRLQGVVNPAEWARFRDMGKPDGWSGMVSGPAVRHFEPEVFEAAWQKVREERGYPEQRYAWHHLSGQSEGNKADYARMVELLGGGQPYTKVTWEVPYWESGAEFLGETLPRLWRLGAAEDVRLCFFFDN